MSDTAAEARGTASIEVDLGLVVLLRKEARARDMPVKRLIVDLLDVIVTDRLVAAVLDDD